jgi:hypothetical protein
MWSFQVVEKSPELIEPASATPESSENRSPETRVALRLVGFHFGLGTSGVGRSLRCSLPAFNGARIEWVPATVNVETTLQTVYQCLDPENSPR